MTHSLLWLFIPLALLQITLFLTALVSILRKDVPAMEKLPWILLALLLNVIGPIIYFVFGSNRLDEAAARKEDAE